MKKNILKNMINNIRVWAIMIVCLMALGVGNAWGAIANPYSFTFSNSELGTYDTSFTKGEVTWSLTDTKDSYNGNVGKYGYIFGSAGSPKPLTVYTSGISGAITQVTVTGRSNNKNKTAIVSVTVGSTTFTTSDDSWDNGDNQTLTFTGSASGTICVHIEPDACGLSLYGISVTYSTTSKTVTFDKQGGTFDDESVFTRTSPSHQIDGASITLPSVSPSSSCASEGWGFYGWATSAVGSSTTTTPAIVGKAGDTYYPSANTTLYAVFAQGEYTKETSSITDDAKYLIVANSGGDNYILKYGNEEYYDAEEDDYFTGGPAVQINETSSGKYAAYAVNATWAYTLDKTSSSYYIRDNVNAAASNYVDFRFIGTWYNYSSSSVEPCTFSVDDGVWNIKSDYDSDDFYLGFDGSDKAFFAYDGAKDILLYKAGTIYYYSNPSCCDKEVALSYNSAGSSNVSAMTFSETSKPTCSGTAGDREVTIYVTPSSGYLFKAGDVLTWTKSIGTIPNDPTLVSGPTLNAGKYEFVYRFAQNDNGAGTFAATASTYTNYLTRCGYSITYDCNSETSGCPADVERAFRLPSPLPTTQTKTGCEFLGWYTDEDLKIEAVAGATLSDDVTLYAKWCTSITTVSGKISVSSINETGGTASWSWSGETTGISKNILKVYDTSDVLVKTIDNISASATSQSISGLTPCTSYYATLTTVASSGYCEGEEQGKSDNFTTNGWAVHYTGGDETEGALLSNVTKTSGESQACLSENYVATFTANTGYDLPSTIIVYIASSEVTAGVDYTWSISAGVGTLTVYTSELSEEIDVRIIGVAKTYTASNNLDKNGGDAHGQYTATYDATTIAINTTPTRTGYTVEGYYEEDECTNKVAAADGTLQADQTYTDGSGKWVYTSAPTLYTNWTAKEITITWNPNGAGASVTPTSSSYTYDGSTVDLPTPTRSLYAFDGWYTEAEGGTEITEVGTTNKPTEDVEYFAHWRALTFEVKDQAGTGTADIHLTSTSGVTVYATSGCGNLITIKANNLDIISNLGGGTANKQNIQIKYLDANNGDAEVAKASSPFRLCNNGSSNYNVADGSNINLNGLTEYSQTYSISYTPSGYGKVDHYKLQLRLQNNTTEAMTITFDLYGRALPKEFVIAAKSGDNWYALPNTLAGTQDAQGAITPVDITSLVDNTTTPTKVTNPDGTATYGATGRYTAANVSGIRFTNDGSHYIQISTKSDNYKMWLSGSGGANVQDWYLKSSDFGAYEVFMDPIGSPSETRRIELYTSSGVKMGHHGTRGTPNIYLLPVEYSKVDDDMSEPSIMEWGTDHVVMELRNSGLAYSYKTQVGGGALSDATELYTVRKDAGVYRLPITLATADAAKELKISFYRSNDAANGVFSFTVPVMISADDAATSSIAAATAAQCDLVVLNGGVLTVSETTSGAKKTFRDLYIYGGGKMVVPTGTYVDFSNVYMRGGHLNASWQYQYSNPQLVLNGTMGNASDTINYDYLTNNAQFYSLALPYPVKLKNIVNPYFNNKRSWEIHAYNGRERSTGGTGWYDVEVGTGVAPNRIEGLGAENALSVGVGYTFWGAMQKVNGTRQLWSVNRFKMPLASGTAEAEKFALDDGVDVKAYGMTYDEDLGEYVYDENVRKNNAGWNMVGNPFLANINGSEDLESDMEAIIIDHHEEKVLDDKGKWTGQMKWVENEEGVRYVRIPYDNGENYHQVRFKDTTFRAFHHFFIQVAVNGKFRLEKKYRAQLAPRRAKATGAALPAEMDIDFILRSSNDKTSFGLTVNDAFVTTFRAGEDMPDELGGVNMKAYTLAGDDRLSYNGLPSDAAEQLIPVGYRAQTAGSHTISHKPGRYDDYIEHIWLTDYVLGQTVDLLYGAYEFTTDAGVIDDRFALNVVFSRNYVPTDIDEVKYDDADEQPIKFIYDDKMLIRYKSVLYDATGKKVGEVRKTK